MAKVEAGAAVIAIEGQDKTGPAFKSVNKNFGKNLSNLENNIKLLQKIMKRGSISRTELSEGIVQIAVNSMENQKVSGLWAGKKEITSGGSTTCFRRFFPAVGERGGNIRSVGFTHGYKHSTATRLGNAGKKPVAPQKKAPKFLKLTAMGIVHSPVIFLTTNNLVW